MTDLFKKIVGTAGLVAVSILTGDLIDDFDIDFDTDDFDTDVDYSSSDSSDYTSFDDSDVSDYNPSFGNKPLPSDVDVVKKSGTSNTFEIIKDHKVLTTVSGGQGTVKIDNIVYNIPKNKTR